MRRNSPSPWPKEVSRLILLALLTAFILAGCITGDAITPSDATATFGAREFHAQLTAVYEEINP